MKRILLLITSILIIMTGCDRSPQSVDFNSYGRTSEVMGTFMEIKIRDNKYSERHVEMILDRAFVLARALEQKLSIYDEDSEINRLNRLKILDVSQDLFNVLKAARNVGLLTAGEFDITVSPVLKQDGFYSDMPVSVLKDVPDSVRGIGWENIEIMENRKVILQNNSTWLDLSGIAKGYIVDRVSEFLYSEGLEYFLVNAGGDIYCGNKENPTDGWLIGIREPAGNSILRVLSLRNAAIATSGDYENVIIDKNTGSALSHIIDPSEEQALIEKPSSITVITATCTDADAFATGMMAMGEDQAIGLANKLQNMEIITSHKAEDKDVIRYSTGAEAYVREDVI